MAEEAGTVVVGRYRLGAKLGHGTSGVVYRAADLVGGAEVAVKVLHPLSADGRARVQREIAALRLLRLPGVVRFVDDGVHEDQRFLVMDLVEGGRFYDGGPARSWDAIAETALALLENLGRVHAAGIVHRDLEPGNVLVDAEGRPTLLDLGLARGVALGETLTGSQVIVGTPRYLAPEQLTGATIDPRADLYAVGVMLYECLSGGALPNPAHTRDELFFHRVKRDPVPLFHQAPAAPEHVAALVDRMVSRAPADRPSSAAEVRAALESGQTLGGRAFPRLGDPYLVARIADAVVAGRSVALWGARGSGRTSTLRRVADALRTRGRIPAWTVPGSRPFQSLVPTLGVPDEHAGATGIMAQRIDDLVAAGGVLLADDVDHCDRWSAALLARAPTGVVRVRDEPGALELPELTERDLRGLFHGSDRILHLREDAARELHRRAGGLPGRVQAELRAWVDAGLCTWRDDKIEIARPALERLAGGLRVDSTPSLRGDLGDLGGPMVDVLGRVALAWPHSTVLHLAAATKLAEWELVLELEELQRRGLARPDADGRWRASVTAAELVAWPEERRRQAHRALAAQLPPGERGRLAHLVGGHDLADAAAEALAIAAHERLHGAPSRAIGTLSLGLAMARAQEDAEMERALLRELIRAAIIERDPAVNREAIYELGRGGGEFAAEAALLGAVGKVRAAGAKGLEALRAQPPIEDEALEGTRLVLLVTASQAYEPTRWEEALEGLRAWASASAARTRWLAEAEGEVNYRRREYETAARSYLVAADLEAARTVQTRLLLGAASAFLESGDYLGAEGVATDARDHAADCRVAGDELRAEWVLRCIAYRTGRARSIDRELVAATRTAGLPWLASQVSFNEACIARALGDRAACAELADAAARGFRSMGFAVAARLADAVPAGLAHLPRRSMTWWRNGSVASRCWRQRSANFSHRHCPRSEASARPPHRASDTLPSAGHEHDDATEQEPLRASHPTPFGSPRSFQLLTRSCPHQSRRTCFAKRGRGRTPAARHARAGVPAESAHGQQMISPRL